MKNLTLILITAFFTIPAIAQITARYSEVRFYQPGFKSYFADILYSDSSEKQYTPLLDSRSKRLKFKNEIEVVTLMQNESWELVSAYQTKGGEIHLFFKKPKLIKK